MEQPYKITIDAKSSENPEASVIGLDLAKLDPGKFWSQWHAVGVEPAEGQAFLLGNVCVARRAEINHQMEKAAEALFNADIAGGQWWMTPKRMMS